MSEQMKRKPKVRRELYNWGYLSDVVAWADGWGAIYAGVRYESGSPAYDCGGVHDFSNIGGNCGCRDAEPPFFWLVSPETDDEFRKRATEAKAKAERDLVAARSALSKAQEALKEKGNDDGEH